MFVIIFLATFICNAVAIPSGRSSRVLGGEAASMDQFPYQVSLRYTSNAQHLCGGSIISESWILTAAHCVGMLYPTEITALVGTNHLTVGGFAHVADIVKKHENYDPDHKLDDIAVLHLRNPVSLSDSVKIIPLTDSATPGEVNGLFSGWGATSYPVNIISNELHYTTLRTINLLDCGRLLEGIYTVTYSHVCTLVSSGTGICLGDSGGPLVVNGKQHGISVFGVTCAKGYPDVFTSVSYFRSWIKEKTNV